MLFAILAYFVIFTAIMFFLVKFAPLGYEDEHGFHYIQKNDISINNGNIGKNLVDMNNKAA